MKDCAHCLIGIMDGPEDLNPENQAYWHCDCWGGDMECCRCELVKDKNCQCEACKK